MVGPKGLPGEPDVFFENLGNGRFRDATAAAGLTDAAGAYGFGVVATDYDGDGRVDLFVANDSNPNFLYRNTTPPGSAPRFESVGLIAGVAVNGEARAQAGMGADAGDYDGDGRIDFALTAFAHDRNTIYRNVDGGGFEDASGTAGIATSTFARMGWGTAFLDADLDGRLDLVVANGHIFSDVDRFPALGETYAQASQLLLNQGGTFRDVSAGTGRGLQTPRVSRGLAVGDLDDDGDPDVVLSNMDAPPALLENRQRTGRHWIAFRLSAPAGNRLAIGATVTVTSGGRTQTREVRSGGSYLSQSDLRPLFGLGDAAGPVSVEVRMPGGARWSWQDLPVDRLHTLELTGTGPPMTGRRIRLVAVAGLAVDLGRRRRPDAVRRRLSTGAEAARVPRAVRAEARARPRRVHRRADRRGDRSATAGVRRGMPEGPVRCRRERAPGDRRPRRAAVPLDRRGPRDRGRTRRGGVAARPTRRARRRPLAAAPPGRHCARHRVRGHRHRRAGCGRPGAGRRPLRSRRTAAIGRAHPDERRVAPALAQGSRRLADRRVEGRSTCR